MKWLVQYFVDGWNNYDWYDTSEEAVRVVNHLRRLGNLARIVEVK